MRSDAGFPSDEKMLSGHGESHEVLHLICYIWYDKLDWHRVCIVYERDDRQERRRDSDRIVWKQDPPERISNRDETNKPSNQST